MAQEAGPAVILEPVPDEPSPPTQVKWKAEEIDLFKYIDDNLSWEKINMENADKVGELSRRRICSGP